jgi:hypothetical protein
VNLTPAKKLMKVTGGRPLANADELRAFHDALSVESIAELVVGLDDADWKVRVRAILGLELAGERYGLQAVAHAKPRVLGLNGSPQASLRTAAVRFYQAIKDVKPGPPAERSAFSFISEEEPPAEDETAGFAFGEAAVAVAVAKTEPAAEAVAVAEEEEEAVAEAPPAEEGEPAGEAAAAVVEAGEAEGEAPPAEEPAVVEPVEGGEE